MYIKEHGILVKLDAAQEEALKKHIPSKEYPAVEVFYDNHEEVDKQIKAAEKLLAQAETKDKSKKSALAKLAKAANLTDEEIAAIFG